MRRLLLLLLTALPLTSWAAVDLTSTATDVGDEGVKYTQLTFRDDKRQVTYTLPQLWSWRGGSSQLQLTPPKSPRAAAVIESRPLDAPVPVDDRFVEVVRQQFARYVPPATNDVKLIGEERDPVPLGGNLRSYEFTASYQAMGETYMRSVLFVNTEDTQLCFKFTAPKAEFPALYRVFRASLTSWQWSTPESANRASVAAAN